MTSGLKWLSLLTVVSTVSGCATTDYASQLMRPDFGYRSFSASSYDPVALMNGPYAPKYTETPCLASDYRCSPRAQLFSIQSEPR